MTEPVHHALARRGLTPGEHAADSGYASADLLLAARARGITLLAPVPPDSSPQARSGGYTADMFTVDWTARRHLPAGRVSSSWTPARAREPASSSPGSPRRPAHRARPGPGTPPRSAPAASSASVTARSTRPSPPPAPGRPAMPGGTGTRYRAGVSTHRPGHPRHRHPPRPLPRPAENPAGTQHRSRRHQPDPARRLVDRQAAGPDPDNPPAAAGPRSMKPENMTTKLANRVHIGKDRHAAAGVRFTAAYG